MARGTLTNQLIDQHLISGSMKEGNEIGVRIDQTLTQDATGTLVMLELEAMGLERVKTEVSAQYVDHNLIQEDYKNPDDHLFLESACKKYGLWYSRPGNGISHPVHMAKFGIPGKTLLGSDSHTCAAGSMAMLAIGAGGLEIALAMAGEPYYLKMPQVMGVKLIGTLPDWVSAKDIILELLRRYDVHGGIGKIIEYYGEGLLQLNAMDRHVIANMGAELGATTSIFPSDERTKEFLVQQNRELDWLPLSAGSQVDYDLHEEIDLSQLEPLIAMPTSPGNVVPVREVEGTTIYQSYVGSSANPGFRDFAMAAEIIRDKNIAAGISFDINPSSREILENLILDGSIGALIHSGARLHQAGCNGCIGMGQAPATGKNSLRTTPRNFPGRSGTQEDSVWLCSPETAAASALYGAICDPRNLGMSYPVINEPREWRLIDNMMQPPLPLEFAKKIELVKGPNIESIDAIAPVPDSFEIPVLLKLGDNISTDTILPAGAKVLPFRSNIPKISEFLFEGIDVNYHHRARSKMATSGHAIIAGDNYGQGSSREHAALAPRYLGLFMVIAKRFARIHRENLVNFGVLPLIFVDLADYERIKEDAILKVENLYEKLRNRKSQFAIQVQGAAPVDVSLGDLSDRQIDLLLRGGAIQTRKIA